MKQKKIALGIFLLVILLPLITIFPTNADAEELDVVILKIWLETPEKQVIVDELISSVEDLGLEANPIYFYDLDAWRFYQGDYDITYGGIMSLPRDGDIFLYAFVNVLLNYYALNHDDAKIFKCVDKLWGMYWDAVDHPDVVDEAFIADMVDAFQDIEERLWEKQYLSVFNRWLEPSSWEWGPVPTIKTEVITYNCLPGHVFADFELRLALNAIIDRNVFLDYHSTYNPYETYLVYHLYQWLPFHDTSLPNCYPED